MALDKDYRGDQATLVVDGSSLPVTEKSLSIDTQTTDAQFDDTKPERTNKSVTGLDISGSFTYNGKDSEFRNTILNAMKDKHRLIFNEDDGTGVRFNGVTISLERDFPSDDLAETSFDWEAEEYVVI